MKLREIRIYQVDPADEKVIQVEKSEYGTDFNDYLSGLLHIISDGSGRTFEFQRDSTEIRGLISKIIANEDFTNVSEKAASRLLTFEKTAQKKVENLKIEIQRGILVQAVYENNGLFQYVICKADHSEFLKDGDYTRVRGLAIKKKVYKAFVSTFTSSDKIESVIVYDTNSTMSKYWWRDYLELNEVYTDKHNTIHAFEAIDKGILTKLKKKYPRDYMHLRNSCVRYFRAKEEFDMNDFIENAIGNYLPYDSDLDVVELKEEIQKLPEKKTFDPRFTIIKDEVKAKFINKIQLTAQIDLYLKEDISNIENIITAETGSDGKKYVKIQSDSGYKYFNERKKTK